LGFELHVVMMKSMGNIFESTSSHCQTIEQCRPIMLNVDVHNGKVGGKPHADNRSGLKTGSFCKDGPYILQSLFT